MSDEMYATVDDWKRAYAERVIDCERLRARLHTCRDDYHRKVIARQTMAACKNCGRRGRGYQNEPADYAQWHEWAEKKGRTHEQHPCPGCGRLTIWRRAALGEADDE